MHSRTGIRLGAAAATLAAAAFVHQRAWQAERRNPPLGRFIEIDGVRLHYIERGAGAPLVMRQRPAQPLQVQLLDRGKLLEQPHRAHCSGNAPCVLLEVLNGGKPWNASRNRSK